MNRRSFLTKLATVAAGFTVLPAATTYARQWKPTAGGLQVPEWVILDKVVDPQTGFAFTLRQLFYEEPNTKLLAMAKVYNEVAMKYAS